MLAKLLIAGLLVSVLLVGGCLESGTTESTTGSMTEDQAFDTIEQEMDEAVENIDVSDIESSLAG